MQTTIKAVSELCNKLNSMGYVAYRYPVKKQVAIDGKPPVDYKTAITTMQSICADQQNDDNYCACGGTKLDNHDFCKDCI